MSVMTTAEKASYDALVSGAAQAVKKDGSVAFTAAQSGVAATAAANLTIRSDLDSVMTVVQAVTTASLPAYTLLSGTVAAGTAVFEANANGAFPTLDANATVTASASEAVTSRFLLSQGAANTDNAVYSLTVQGDGGTKFRFAMLSTLNSAAKLLGSRIRVVAGEQCAGAEYQHMYEGTLTLGTTPFYMVRTDSRMSSNEGIQGRDVCGAQAIATASPNDSDVSFIISGAGAAVTQLNPASFLGEYNFATGTTNSAIVTARLCSIPVTANTDIDVAGTFQIPTLSTAGQEFIFNAGCFVSVAGGVIANGFCFVYDRLNKGVNLWAKTVSGGTSTGTFTDTGIVVTAGRRYRWRVLRRAGDTAARLYVGSSADAFALVATHSANHPTGDMSPIFGGVYKTAGTSTVNAAAISGLTWCCQFPTRLAA